MRNRISAGEFSPGSLFLSVRTIAAEYQCSPRTAALALQTLCRDGLLLCERNSGFRIPGQNRSTPRILVCARQMYATDPVPQIAESIMQRLKERAFPYDLRILKKPMQDFSEIAGRYGAVISARYTGKSEFLTHDTICAHGLVHTVANIEEDRKILYGSYVDRYALTRKTIEMLYSMGHRKIAILVRDPDRFFYRDMVQAYQDTMQELHLKIRSGYIAVMKQSFELGSYLAARELLALPEPPTVVIVGRDYQASGIYQACIDNQLIPGKDLSIIGYGDFGWADGKTFLTTYREPVEALGAAAADIACDILQGKDRPKRREIHPELLMRQSLSPIIRSPFP
ncbi:MAG: substrate-binding domain-containing protein [Lentisphaeria bacterium]|nr:substrate-binding domain-containing protein [Lentisphaeria bacterium]